MAVKGTVQLDINVIDDGDLSEVARGAIPHRFQELRKLVDGNLSHQIEAVVSDLRTLAAGTDEDIDVAGGVTDVYGNTVTLTSVRLFVMWSESTTAGDDLTVSPSAVNPLAISGVVYADGYAMFYAPNGLTVTDASADSFNVDNSTGNDITYNYLICGTTS